MFFSESLKREVTKVVLAAFVYTNLSPAFCMQAPRAMTEYIVDIQRRQIIDDATQQMMQGFAVQVLQRQMVQQAAATIVAATATTAAAVVQTAYVYQTICEQVVAPFVMLNMMQTAGIAKLYEILQNVKATVESQAKTALFTEKTPPQQNVAETAVAETNAAETPKTEIKTVETAVSHGFCLNIPELGDLLISHDGDVVFDSTKSIGKSIKIKTPAQLILNNMTATDIDVEATAAILTGKTKVSINSLHFSGIADDDNPTNGLFIDNESELEVGDLSLEDALLVNAGKLTVKQTMDLNGGCFFNAGSVKTAANPTVLRNISYLSNSTAGRVEASDKLVLGATTISNLGTIKANKIDVIAAKLLDNQGTLESTSALEISGPGDLLNNGLINGNSGSVAFRNDKFEQAKQGEIRSAQVNFNSPQTLLAGKVAAREGNFKGNVANEGTLQFYKGVVDGTLQNVSNNAVFSTRLELTGNKAVVQNSGKITTPEVISSTNKGILDGGEITATSLQSKKHLETNAKFPNLKSIKTDRYAEFLVQRSSQMPNLQNIENSGTTVVKPDDITQLSRITSATNASLKIETSSSLYNVSTLDNVSGTLEIGARLPNVKSLNINKDTQLLALPTANFPNLSDLQIQKGGKFVAEKNSKFDALKELTNEGTAVLNTPLNIDYLHNSNGAKLQLSEKTKVTSSDNEKSKQTILTQ
jgi:adhesin HecA-like repeat protein